MRKNAHIHILIETERIEKLRREASDLGISFSELCRVRLGHTSTLTRIEFLISELNKKLNTQLNTNGRLKW